MDLNPNEKKAALPVERIAVPIALEQNVVRDPSVMLNGGKPIQIGFNTAITINPLNTDTYKDTIAKADPSVFPSGLKGLPAGFTDFATKVEPALFKWLSTPKNLTSFISNPVNALQSFSVENKLQIPEDIKSFLVETQRKNAGLRYNTAGARYKTVTASLGTQKK